MTLPLTAVLLGLGTVVVTPVCLALNPRVRAGVGRLALIPGVLAAVGLALPPGPLAVALALPWLLVAAGLVLAAVPATWRLVRSAPEAAGLVRVSAPLVGLGFWGVGAGWLLLDRLALDPLGVGGDLVLLTAVHFHFAGLAGTTIVWRSDADRPDQRLLPALVGVLAAPPVVAVGFAAVPVLQIAGAVLFTAALLWWSACAGRRRDRSRLPWLVARASVWLTMPLAVWWAIGFVTGVPAPSIPAMAATHGVLNAVGFALAGGVALLVPVGRADGR